MILEPVVKTGKLMRNEDALELKTVHMRSVM